MNSTKFIFFVFGEIPLRSTCMLTLHNYEIIVREGCTNIVIAEKTLGFLKDGISRIPYLKDGAISRVFKNLG